MFIRIVYPGSPDHFTGRRAPDPNPATAPDVAPVPDARPSHQRAHHWGEGSETRARRTRRNARRKAP
jgi:hypothetical protein